MAEPGDNPGVIAPPPLLLAAVFVLGLLLDWLAPAYILYVLLSFVERVVIGLVLVAAGVTMAIAAIGEFRASGTAPEPWKPSTTVVTDGIYGWARNPMYVAGNLLLVGLAILMASDWMLVLTILCAPVLHFGVVRREERYLEAKFGNDYRRYKARVSRYGLPF